MTPLQPRRADAEGEVQHVEVVLGLGQDRLAVLGRAPDEQRRRGGSGAVTGAVVAIGDRQRHRAPDRQHARRRSRAISGSKATMRSKFDPSTSPSSHSRRSRSSWLARPPFAAARQRLGQEADRRRAQPGERAGRDDLGPEDDDHVGVEGRQRARAAARRRRRRGYSWKRVSKRASVPVSSTQASKYVDCPTKARRSGRSSVAIMERARVAATAAATIRPRCRPTTTPSPRRARSSTRLVTRVAAELAGDVPLIDAAALLAGRARRRRAGDGAARAGAATAPSSSARASSSACELRRRRACARGAGRRAPRRRSLLALPNDAAGTRRPAGGAASGPRAPWRSCAACCPPTMSACICWRSAAPRSCPPARLPRSTSASRPTRAPPPPPASSSPSGRGPQRLRTGGDGRRGRPGPRARPRAGADGRARGAARPRGGARRAPAARARQRRRAVRERRVKVAFLVNDLQLSGGVGVVVAHARQLHDRHGFDVTLVLAREQEDPHWSHEPLEGLPVVSLEEARGARYDVAISTWWETAFSLFELRAERYASFVQSLEDRFYRPGEAERLGARLVLDLPVTFITEARWIADTLAGLRPSAPCHLVRNGIDKRVFAAGGDPRAARRRPAARPRRGQRRASGSRASTRPSRPSGRWASPTTSPWWRPTATGLVADGADRVVGPLSQRELAALYAETDVLVKLSRVEGMYGPPLEAFHMGATCVTTEVTGHEEYVEHGRQRARVRLGRPARHRPPARPPGPRPRAPARAAPRRPRHRPRLADVGAGRGVHGRRAARHPRGAAARPRPGPRAPHGRRARRDRGAALPRGQPQRARAKARPLRAPAGDQDRPGVAAAQGGPARPHHGAAPDAADQAQAARAPSGQRASAQRPTAASAASARSARASAGRPTTSGRRRVRRATGPTRGRARRGGRRGRRACCAGA